MIKITQVNTQLGECYLTIQYTVQGQTQTVTVNRAEVVERLKTVKKTLGRALTLQDVKLVVIRLIDELREGKAPLTEEFDYSQFIGVDLEP